MSKKSSKRPLFFKIRALLWITAFGITFAALAAILLLPHNVPPVAELSRQHDVTSNTGVKPAPRGQFQDSGQLEPERSKQFVYEEKIGADFDLRVWEADMAILQTLSLMGHSEDRITHNRIETKFFYGTPYHFQEITIYTSNAHKEFVSNLKNSLDRFLTNVSLSPMEHDERWAININGQNTHVINLKRIFEKPLPGTGKMVIIIDDLGESLEFARKLGRLDFPVIFSILPYKTNTAGVLRFAEENGIERMLHLPMEPNTYSRGVDPGAGALFVSQDCMEIRRRVIDNLNQVPGVIGVNNHMGSRFTRDMRGMGIVFDELKKRGLFFLDSKTTPDSVAEKLAEEYNVAFLKRNIFLDNVQDKNAILFQLSKTENYAKRHGMAVAIGHPYPETLKALKEWSTLRDKNVEVVQISECIAISRYRTASQSRPQAKN